MASYKLKLSNRAQNHLKKLYIDGFKNWGEKKADQYYSDLLTHFEMICENPFLYVAVEEIRAGYRRSVYGKHSVYYRSNKNTVEIMGILKKQNPQKQL